MQFVLDADYVTDILCYFLGQICSGNCLGHDFTCPFFMEFKSVLAKIFQQHVDRYLIQFYENILFSKYYLVHVYEHFDLSFVTSKRLTYLLICFYCYLVYNHRFINELLEPMEILFSFSVNSNSLFHYPLLLSRLTLYGPNFFRRFSGYNLR